MPPPERRRTGLLQSVNPPDHVAPALGDTRTQPFNQGLRIAAVVLADAAMEVGSIFSPTEWKFISEVFSAREIDPEQTDPGPVLAAHIERSYHLYGDSLASSTKEVQLASVIEKVRKLTYLQTWAAIISVQFWQRYRDVLPPTFKWWELGFRRAFLMEAIKKRRQDRKGE